MNPATVIVNSPPSSSAAPPLFDRLRPGPGQSRSDVVMSQRDRLQRALIELAAAGGYESVTVRKLTRLARVSTGAFYAQFDGTDDCLVSTYGWLMGVARERIEVTRSPSRKRSEQCGQSVAALLTSFLGDPGAARLALFEVFGAGPAAVSSAHSQETELERALRQSLNRRGRRVVPSAVAWITAGVLHCTRQALDSGAEVSPSTVKDLVAWGQACLVDPPPEIGLDRPPLSQPRRDHLWPRADLSKPPGDETELILSAIIRLAKTCGYHGLSPSRTSKAAGVPASRFKRYFVDADDAYLTGVARAADDLFAGFRGRGERTNRSWPRALCEQVLAVSQTTAVDADLAKLVFAGILAPGLIGLTRRETLIHELASSWRDSLSLADRPTALVAEASMAALWNSISRSVDLGHTNRLPERAAVNSYWFLAPMIGTKEAAEVIAIEFGSAPRRSPQMGARRAELAT
jgi:AcrR family transcriptional regulator